MPFNFFLFVFVILMRSKLLHFFFSQFQQNNLFIICHISDFYSLKLTSVKQKKKLTEFSLSTFYLRLNNI